MLRAAAVMLLCCGALHAQGRGARVSAADLAILDEARPRRDFPCTVRAIKPALAFDFRLHAGYQASIRPAPGSLQVVTRVTPAGAQPVYIPERARIPNLDELRNKRLTVTSRFALGEGSYRVDSLIRDQSGGVCSARWNVEAKLPRRARGISLTPPGQVQSDSPNPFRRQAPVSSAGQGLRVKVLSAGGSVSRIRLTPSGG